MIIQKARDIYSAMYCYKDWVACSAVLVGRGQYDRFMHLHLQLLLQSAQVMKQARNEAILEGLWGFFCEIS